jgi:hypothetical protein
VTPTLFNLLWQLASISEAELNILLDLNEVQIDAVLLSSPVNRVKPSLNYLIFNWLLVRCLLLSKDIRIEEVYFCLLNLG